MRKFTFILFLIIAFGCSNESDPAAVKDRFTKIYNHDNFNTSYYPIDIRQTPDGGYLILGGRKIEDSNFSGIYILKVDAVGAFISEQEVDETYVNPVGPILESGGNYYFFAMNSLGLQTELFQMDAEGALSDPQSVGVTYPAAAAQDGTGFVLLSYDNFNKLTVVSQVSATGGLGQSQGFPIGAGDAVEEPIMSHFLRTGRLLPFFVGKTTTGQYYFNGFYNYTLSLAFTNLGDDEPEGIVQGQQDDGGISQATALDGGKFALSRFNFGDNYILPNSTLNTSGISSSVDLGGNTFPELVANAPVRILRITLAGQKKIIYGSHTRSSQIGLYAYDEATGDFVGSRYLGFSNPFEIAALISTSDGGLAVCGTTYMAGRFPRICIFKLSAKEVNQSFL